MTVIAFIGSVFSPYYAAMRRIGAANPTDHVALNLALYGVRGPAWAMTERGADALEQSANRLVIGPSALHFLADGSLLITIDERAAPLPRRLRGEIRLMPAARFTRSYALDANHRHFWSPLAPCARLSLAFTEPALTWQGNAYLDTNTGSAPLEADFRHWDWSRATLDDGSTLVFYDALRADESRLGLARWFQPDGTVKPVTLPPRQALPRGLWRMPRACHGDGAARLVKSFEDSPFYTRALVETQWLGQPRIAVQESLSLTKFSQRWVQALLPYRIPR